MLLLPKKNKNNGVTTQAGKASDSAARTIAGAIVNRQKQLALFCSTRYEKLTVRGKRLLLLLFCLLFGSACLWSLVRGLLPVQKQQIKTAPQPMNPAKNIPDSLNLAKPGRSDTTKLK